MAVDDGKTRSVTADVFVEDGKPAESVETVDATGSNNNRRWREVELRECLEGGRRHMPSGDLEVATASSSVTLGRQGCLGAPLGP